MNSSVIRLLTDGLRDKITGARLADPLSPEEFIGTMSSPHMDASWTEMDCCGIRWHECTVQELRAPLYATGWAVSSLDIAASLAFSGILPVWACTLCLNQTSGRGQLRRTWESPVGNIYAALRLPSEIPFCGPAAAVAVGALLAEALRIRNFPVSIKWPNDLLQPAEGGLPGLNLEKVCGILIEEHEQCILAGIGINISSAPSPELLRSGHACPAGVLHKCRTQSPIESEIQHGIPAFPCGFWIDLLSVVRSVYDEVSRCSEWWVSLAEKHLAFKGQQVCILNASSNENPKEAPKRRGRITGISSEGSLELLTSEGREAFFEGTLDFPGA